MGYIRHRIESPGLWGIESDSGEDYFDSVFQEEKGILTDMLVQLGVTIEGAMKTIKVADLIAIVNRRNRSSTCSPLVRMGWNSLLEEVLVETGNYAGFLLLSPDEVPEDEKPGIVIVPNVEEDTEVSYPDESRRKYLEKLRTNKP